MELHRFFRYAIEKMCKEKKSLNHFNITLGYSFKDLFKTSAYKGIGGRIYATAQNPFIITKYEGLDPEVKSGIDSNPYPRAFTFLLGVNLQF